MGKDKHRRAARNDRHVRLYQWLTASPAWQDLSGNAVKLLIYMASFDFGQNNGEIFMSWRHAAIGIGVSENTAGKALKELVDHGFIRPTQKGHFCVKRGPATQWRLTWLSWPAMSLAPSNEWRRWTPQEEKSRAQELGPTASKVVPISTARRITDAKKSGVEAKTTPGLAARNEAQTIAIGEAISALPVVQNEPALWWRR